jgi:hypothetical protein
MMVLATTTRSRRGSVAPKGRCIRYANLCTQNKSSAIEVEVVANFRKFVAIDLDFVTIAFYFVAIDGNVVPVDSDVVPVDLNFAAIDLDPLHQP